MSILEYWRSRPEYWIALGPNQAKADEEITRLFWNKTPIFKEDDWISFVIYNDQFVRHFSRVPHTGVDEERVSWGRQLAYEVIRDHVSELYNLDEVAFYFCMMALKHVEDYQRMFGIIKDWIPKGKSLTDFPILSRFFNDSYKKAYSDEGIVMREAVQYITGKYNPAEICEFYPPPPSCEPELPTCAESMCASLRAIYDDSRPLLLSLSGGVDSMVMCTLLKRMGIKFTAVHINYGNRACSRQEKQFVHNYCWRIGVPIWMHTIKWLRRGFVEREFYESMTRALRFEFYRGVGGENADVCLGHIREDMIENVWTNLAKGTHLDDPGVFKLFAIEDGVTICRPWIHVKKEDVYTVAKALSVPYLKNTTPSWSNRGKFRETFYEATRAQYGASVDDKILETAAALTKQASLVEKLLYTPMLNSWNDTTRSCIITRGVEAELDGSGWNTYFTTLCHTKLGISKPSIHACADFAARVGRATTEKPLKIHMKKDLTVLVTLRASESCLQVVS
jgi:tRNA(Ile)-lysidine synthetase-like protein